MFGFMATKYDPLAEGRTNGEVIVEGSVEDFEIREGLLGRKEGNRWNL